MDSIAALIRHSDPAAHGMHGKLVRVRALLLLPVRTRLSRQLDQILYADQPTIFFDADGDH
jgi:hypothetical protein